MQIVLLILEFFGWFLLVVFLLLVFALFIILFHPMRYVFDVHWMEEQNAYLKASWFFRFIRAKISYSEELIWGQIYIFWKKISFSYDMTEKKDAEPSESKEKKVKVEEQGIISKIKGMIERIKNAYPKIKKMFMDKKNKEAIEHLKKEFIVFLKVLLPKKTKVDVLFSTGSPDTTGQVFGIIACFPASYQKNWKIVPDFQSDELYFKGNVYGKGKIYGCELIGIILRIIFDKNCRRLYTMLQHFKNWLKKNNQREGIVNG